MQSIPPVLIVFVAITGLAFLMQACMLAGILIALLKTAKKVDEISQDVKTTVLPVVHSTRDLLQKISPQVISISADIASIAKTVQGETKEVKESVNAIMDRVSRQTERLDVMLTHGLNSVEKAGSALESAVAVPVRKVNGVMAAAKAMLHTYRAVTPKTYENARAQENVAEYARHEVLYPDPDRDIVI